MERYSGATGMILQCYRNGILVMQEYLRLCKKITGSRGFLLSNRTLCPHNHTVKKVVLSTPAAPARAYVRRDDSGSTCCTHRDTPS